MDEATEVRFKALEDDANNNKRSHKEFYESLESIRNNLSVLSLQSTQMMKDINELSSSIATITQRSGKRWDAVTEKIILVVVGAIAASVLNRVGL